MGLFDDIQAEAEKYISLPKAFDHIAAAEGSEYKAAMVMAHYIEDFGLLDCCWMDTDRRPVWQDTFGNNHSAWDFIQEIKDFYEFPFDEMDPLSKEIRSKYLAFFFRKSDFFGIDIIKRLGLEEPVKDCESAPSLLSKQSAYDLTEAACLLSGHSPVMVDLCRNDTNFIKNYADYLEAESFIRNAWAVGEINRDNGVFPRAEIKKLFERAYLHVAGLTEESAPIPASPEPAPQQTEPASLDPTEPESATDDYPSGNIGKRNQIKKDLQGMARIMAAHWWSNEPTQTSIGDMADRVYREVAKFAPDGYMPETADAVKGWIRPVAPEYASKPGRR